MGSLGMSIIYSFMKSVDVMTVILEMVCLSSSYTILIYRVKSCLSSITLVLVIILTSAP